MIPVFFLNFTEKKRYSILHILYLIEYAVWWVIDFDVIVVIAIHNLCADLPAKNNNNKWNKKNDMNVTQLLLVLFMRGSSTFTYHVTIWNASITTSHVQSNLFESSNTVCCVHCTMYIHKKMLMPILLILIGLRLKLKKKYLNAKVEKKSTKEIQICLVPLFPCLFVCLFVKTYVYFSLNLSIFIQFNIIS